MVYDYIVIGAGISGVQAADILASKKNTSFLLLEAQPSIGGRIGSIAISGLEEVKKADWVKKNIEKINAVIVEKGATWVEQRHLVLLELCKQFGITLREQHGHGQGLYMAKDRPYTSSELMKHPEYAETIKLIIEVIDELSVQYNKVVYSDLKVTSPDAKKLLKKYDRITLTEFLNQRIPERLKFVREVFDNFFEHTECCKSADNSMHEVLTKNARSNDLAILKELLGDFGHEPSYLLNGGTSLLISSFIKEIQKKLKRPISDVLKLSHQVITVDNRSKHHTTVICHLPGNVVKKYRCKQVICAVPLTVARSISFENLSKAKRLIIDNQLNSNSKKSFMITKTPFWRRDSNGKPVVNGDGLFSNDHLANYCHDISPPDESCGVMVFFQHGKKLDTWEATFSDEDYDKKRNYFVQLMSQMYKVKPEDKKRLFDGCIYHECSYMNDQFIKSGFQSLTRPGTFNQVLDMGDSLEALYRDEFGITFVGSEYSLQFASYMQGAVRITRQKVYKLIGEKDPLAHLLVENSLPTH